MAFAVVLGTIVIASQGFAAGEQEMPNGAAVTVLKATRSCFSATVEVTGILIPKNETAVRPERPGLKVAEILVEPGQSVTAGQALALLNRPDGGSTQVQAAVAGLLMI
jgi:multidrug efflux pump subunit AcrA (membrane-fusion protein)